jgi:CHAT domain-containing protein
MDLRRCGAPVICSRLRPSSLAAVCVVVVMVTVHVLTAAAMDEAAARVALAKGLELRTKGNALGSRAVLLEVVDYAQKSNDRKMLQDALGGLADAASDLSDWTGQLDYAQRAYDAMPDPHGPARILYLTKRGRVMQELHERDQAFAAYNEAIALAQQLNDRSYLARLYNEIGLATWRFDRDKPRALKYYDDAIAMFEALHDYRGAMVAWNNSGNIFRYPESYPEAERRYRAGFADGRRAGYPDYPLLLKNLGIVLRETGRRKEAEQLLLQAVAVADAKGIARTQWQGRMELGLFYSTTDLPRATQYFEDTLTKLEGLNNNVLLEGFTAGALSGAVTIYDDPYDLYTDMLLTHDRDRDAYVVAERARARAFLDTLSLAREQIAAALPPEFVMEERSLLERISENQGALRAVDLAAARRASLQATVAADEERLSRIRVRLAADQPAIAHARYPRVVSVEEVQAKLLKPDEVLLEYFLGAKSGTLWILTANDFQVRRLPARDEIEKAVRPYLDALANPDAPVPETARSLTTMLLPDLDRVLTDRSRLTVVPNGILTYLPFETLMTARNKFLIEERPVAYAPSASSLSFLRSRHASGTDVLAIGNPVMRGAGAEKERGQSLSRIGYLKPLAFSGPEVESVSAVFGSRAHIYEQGAATEAVLRDPLAARAGIIHIATHGLIDEELPDRSGLALTAALPESDGILQMREIYNLRLNAALVTLSACQTALGKEVTGEGMIGLSRAFFYAGANAVLASLWNVNDASTPQLMTPFYEHLAAGQSIDESLRAAKIAMLQGGGKLRHPYYWAAFVVSGDGSAATGVHPEFPRKTWAIALAGTVVLALGILFWRRVR